METKIIQVESLSGMELLERFDRMESTLQKLVARAEREDEQPAEYMSRTEVANFFSVTLPTIHEWINKGILTAYKAGNKTYFKRSEVVSALAKKNGRYA